jgi:hypothetical protein
MCWEQDPVVCKGWQSWGIQNCGPSLQSPVVGPKLESWDQAAIDPICHPTCYPRTKASPLRWACWRHHDKIFRRTWLSPLLPLAPRPGHHGPVPAWPPLPRLHTTSWASASTVWHKLHPMGRACNHACPPACGCHHISPVLGSARASSASNCGMC